MAFFILPVSAVLQNLYLRDRSIQYVLTQYERTVEFVG